MSHCEVPSAGSRAALASAGALEALLGATVLAGWYGNHPWLVQLAPGQTPMAPRSALSFVFLGAGLVVLALRRQRLCLVCASLAAFSNALVLFEYGTSIRIDLDRLLHLPESLTAVKAVAPNTAVCFILLSAAVFCMGTGHLFHRRGWTLALLGSTATAMSLISLIGYISGLRTFEWGQAIPMAWTTALGLSVLGSVVVFFGWRDEQQLNEAGPPPWLFVSAFMVAAVFTVSMWQALAAGAANQARRTIAMDAEEVRTGIASQMQLRTAVLVRAARRWERLGKPPQSDWDFEANLLLSDVLDFRAVEWVDGDLRIRLVAPWKGNERLLQADLGLEPRHRAAFESARKLQRPVLTRRLDLLTGGPGLQIYVPVFKGDSFLGFVVGSFLLDELFAKLVPAAAAPGEQIEILDGDELVYARHDGPATGARTWLVQRTLELNESRWLVRIWPSPERLAGMRSRLAETVLVLGLLLSILVGTSVFLAQQAWMRARTAVALRRKIEKETGERLQAVQELDQMFTLSLEMLCIAGLDGWFKRVNPAFERVLGYSTEKMLHTPFLDLVHPDDRELTVAALKRLGAGVPLTAFENRYIARDGSVRWIQWACAPVPERQLTFASARDITERKEAQEALQRVHAELEDRVRERTAALAQSQAEVLKLNRQLEKQVRDLTAVNQELEAFTYSVSHDLRAPLRHVDGFSKILLEDFGKQLPEEARPLLDQVRRGSQRMGRMVDELLELSRTARRQPEKSLTGLRSLVEEVIAELKTETGEREVEWRVGDLPFADCDPALTRQIFVNLLSNAVKFTRTRRRAVIEVGQVEADGRTAMFVRDNGVGFSMKYADKLFGAFQRLHRQEDFEGTGVGLATVQRIVHKHGGRIWAEAALDQGATFYFTLGPSAAESAAPAAEILEVHDVIT